MASSPDPWDAYLWEPGGTVLRNLYDVRDGAELQRREYRETHLREREILGGRVSIPRTYDAEHLRKIHGHLFGRVYEWAGQYRTVNISKGFSDFAHTSEIDRYLTDVSRTIRSADWANLDRDGFAHAAATTFSYVNQGHPFREGNGRASKVFMHHVAELSPWHLDFDPATSGITPRIWNQASMLSGPDRGDYEPVPDSLVPIFRALAQPRTTPSPEPVLSEAERDMMLVRAAYPRPATEAVRTNPSTVAGERTHLPRGIAPRDRRTGRGE